MKIDLNHMITLDAIVRLGSFQAAADELHKAKSAVSYTVKQMEMLLGIEVFDRSKQKAILTEAGLMLLEESKKILKHTRRLEEKLDHLSSGWEPVFRLAYDESLKYTTIFPLFKAFYQHCSKTNLDSQSHTLGGCWDALLSKEVDCAIGVSGIITQREDYHFVPMGELPFAFVVGATHPLAAVKSPLTKAQIEPYLAIYISDSTHSPCKQTYDMLTNKKTLVTNSVMTKVELIAAGVGVGFLPTAMIKSSPFSSELVIKQINIQRPTAMLSLAYHKNKQDSKVIQWLLGFVKNNNDKIDD